RNCGRDFGTARLLGTHTTAAHGKGFPCLEPKCGRDFGSEGLLGKHTTAAHGKGFPCLEPKCGREFGTASRLGKHTTAAHGSGFPCLERECDGDFGTARLLRDHMRVVHRKGVPCPVCKRHFISASRVRLHLNRAKGCKKDSVGHSPQGDLLLAQTPAPEGSNLLIRRQNKFTSQDDLLLAQALVDASTNIQAFRDLARLHPEHSVDSWYARYLKNIEGISAEVERLRQAAVPCDSADAALVIAPPLARARYGRGYAFTSQDNLLIAKALVPERQKKQAFEELGRLYNHHTAVQWKGRYRFKRVCIDAEVQRLRQAASTRDGGGESPRQPEPESEPEPEPSALVIAPPLARARNGKGYAFTSQDDLLIAKALVPERQKKQAFEELGQLYSHHTAAQWKGRYVRNKERIDLDVKRLREAGATRDSAE
ncbi:hypothetical protein EXIGLDRAFT_767843, partial [Exidia glandulosa HHB12029]